VLNSHWPKLQISDSRLVNSRVDHHQSINGHEHLNVALGDSVVMMSADSSKDGLSD
jgi:hypothetical protein